MSFEKNYWSEIYDGRSIDGTFNAAKHADYIKSIFALSEFPVKKIIDIGFGKGKILEAVVKKFNPATIIALDPSKLMVNSLSKKSWIQKYNIAIVNKKFQEFKIDYLQKYPLDLAIANSVFQYIEDVEEQLKRLSTIARFCYFSVPTKNDYTRMERDFNFVDKYAFARTKEFYVEMISKYFTRVSYNLLESKLIKEHEYFTAELYRE